MAFLKRKGALDLKLTWSLTIYFFVALYSCVRSCPKLSQKVFSVLILQLTCFIFIASKRKQTMEQQRQRACEWTKSSNQKKTKEKKVTSHSNWPRALQFHLANKQCNGIINSNKAGLFEANIRCDLYGMIL